jgi:hypothetical protein
MLSQINTETKRRFGILPRTGKTKRDHAGHAASRAANNRETRNKWAKDTAAKGGTAEGNDTSFKSYGCIAGGKGNSSKPVKH